MRAAASHVPDSYDGEPARIALGVGRALLAAHRGEAHQRGSLAPDRTEQVGKSMLARARRLLQHDVAKTVTTVGSSGWPLRRRARRPAQLVDAACAVDISKAALRRLSSRAVASAGVPSRVVPLRLASHRLVGAALPDVAAAVRWMLAVQAQDFAGAKWSVGLRTEGGTDAAVEDALASGGIVRSWPLRGTLHFCAAEDLRWMLSLGAPRVIAGARARRAALGIDERVLGRARELAVEALSGRRALTRAAILEAFERGGLATAQQRGYHLLWHLSQTGTLCFGPTRGKEQTFVLLDEWVKISLRLEREQALGELARRYFASHGPATARDLASWAKLSAAEVKTGVAVAGPALATLTEGGLRYWMAADAEAMASAEVEDAGARGSPRGSRPTTRSSVPVLALPGFDEYVLGYRDRDAVVPPRFASRICPGGNGVFMPTIMVDGRAVGTWRRATRAKRVELTAIPFTRLTRAAAEGFREAAAAHGRFLGVPVRVRQEPPLREAEPR